MQDLLIISTLNGVTKWTCHKVKLVEWWYPHVKTSTRLIWPNDVPDDIFVCIKTMALVCRLGPLPCLHPSFFTRQPLSTTPLLHFVHVGSGQYNPNRLFLSMVQLSKSRLGSYDLFGSKSVFEPNTQIQIPPPWINISDNFPSIKRRRPSQLIQNMQTIKQWPHA